MFYFFFLNLSLGEGCCAIVEYNLVSLNLRKILPGHLLRNFLFCSKETVGSIVKCIYALVGNYKKW